MKANELMIGDWVTGKKWRENPFKLSRINDNGKYYYGITSDGTQVGLFLLEEIEPIPLTPEILEKNLATEPQIAWCVGWNKKDDIHVEIKRDDLNAAFYGVIDFVHQLQHALRLCGIEKEIIL